MPTLAQIVSDRATATLGEGDAALHIAYRPQQASTPNVLRLARDMGRYDEASADEDSALDLIDRLVSALCDLIHGWDLQEDDGAPVAVTPERLERIGIETLAAIFGAVLGDARAGMGKATGTRSPTPISGGFTPKAAKTTSRRGASRKKSA